MAENDLEKLRRVKEAVEPMLLKLPGVNGVDIGYKESGGRRTDTLAIRVYVQKKQDLPPQQAIPHQIQGVPTDVIERSFSLNAG